MNKGEKPRSGYRTNCKSKRVLEKVKLYEPISIAYPQMSTPLQQQTAIMITTATPSVVAMETQTQHQL